MSKGTAQMRLSTLALLSVVTLAAMPGASGADEQSSQRGQDPLRPIAAMLTKSVLITRRDAGVRKADVITHTHSLRGMFAQFVARASDSLPEPYSDDVHLHGDVGEMLSTIDITRVFLKNGGPNEVHHAFKGLRLQVGELRSRNGVVALEDMIWRYNCAFHPMMHEVMHRPAGVDLTEDQVKTCADAAVNAELALAAVEAVASHARYAGDPELTRLVAGCKGSLEDLSRVLAIGRSAEVVAAVKKLRKRFIALAARETESIGTTASPK